MNCPGRGERAGQSESEEESRRVTPSRATAHPATDSGSHVAYSAAITFLISDERA
jgi:hypothetical protein